VVFVHGTASFNVASAGTMAHWASRGFIVMAADHPGLNLADQITSCPAIPNVSNTLGAEVDTEMYALKTPTGAFAPRTTSPGQRQAGRTGGGDQDAPPGRR